jgi:hypothetical protein
LNKPSSKLQAAVHKWKIPVSQEYEVLADIFDLLAAVNSKRKPKPYPRPWPTGNKQRIGSAKTLTRSQVIERLKKMNADKE